MKQEMSENILYHKRFTDMGIFLKLLKNISEFSFMKREMS